MVEGKAYCMGTGFPVGAGGVARCRDFANSNTNYGYPESDNVDVMKDLGAVSTIPSSKKIDANGTVGPYFERWGSDLFLFTALDGRNGGACPSSSTEIWARDAQRSTILCELAISFN